MVSKAPGKAHRKGIALTQLLRWSPDDATLTEVVEAHESKGATVYTDEAAAYGGLSTIFNCYEHKTVRHSVSEYVKGLAHINGMELFWALLKRGYHGIYHQMSVKHLGCYVAEFARRHNNVFHSSSGYGHGE